MREANILYLVVSKFCDVDLPPDTVPNDQMGLIFENLIRRFNELANALSLADPLVGTIRTPDGLLRSSLRPSGTSRAVQHRPSPARSRKASRPE